MSVQLLLFRAKVSKKAFFADVPDTPYYCEVERLWSPDTGKIRRELLPLGAAAIAESTSILDGRERNCCVVMRGSKGSWSLTHILAFSVWNNLGLCRSHQQKKHTSHKDSPLTMTSEHTLAPSSWLNVVGPSLCMDMHHTFRSTDELGGGCSPVYPKRREL